MVVNHDKFYPCHVYTHCVPQMQRNPNDEARAPFLNTYLYYFLWPGCGFKASLLQSSFTYAACRVQYMDGGSLCVTNKFFNFDVL
jgi:hypothetical protein